MEGKDKPVFRASADSMMDAIECTKKRRGYHSKCRNTCILDLNFDFDLRVTPQDPQNGLR